MIPAVAEVKDYGKVAHMPKYQPHRQYVAENQIFSIKLSIFPQS